MLLEFLIRPEQHQLEAAAGDNDRYRNEILLRLIVSAIEETYPAGVRPDLWKVAGVPTAAAIRQIGQAALTTGADCIVPGSGAGTSTVGRWLGSAAATEGYRDFAVHRTIRQDAARASKQDRDDGRFAEQVADRCLALARKLLPLGVAGSASNVFPVACRGELVPSRESRLPWVAAEGRRGSESHGS